MAISDSLFHSFFFFQRVELLLAQSATLEDETTLGYYSFIGIDSIGAMFYEKEQVIWQQDDVETILQESWLHIVSQFTLSNIRTGSYGLLIVKSDVRKSTLKLTLSHLLEF